MRFLTILVAVLACLYGGYWFVGSAAVERAATSALDGLRADGWEVDYAGVETRGFPSRFDTTVSDVRLYDPAAGIAWAAPFVQVLALSYRPTEVIAVLPETQEVELPDQSLTVTGDGLRASASVRPGLSLPLDRVTAEGSDLTVASDLGWTLRLDHLLAAFRDAGPAEADYDLFGEFRGIAPPRELVARVDPEGALPATLDEARLDAMVTLDRPLDRHAMEGDPPGVTAVTLRGASLTWGAVTLTASGALTVAPDGTPDGTVTLAATGWRQVLDMAVALGLVDPGVAPTWERVAEMFTSGSEVLEADIAIREGQMFLGPLPLGPAPRFR